jgi:hypothetical protein
MLAARPQVSNIAQTILSELDRVRGTRMKLTLDIDAETAVGFPEDVETPHQRAHAQAHPGRRLLG